MKYWFKYIAAIVSVTAAVSCKKPYNPPAIASPGTYLVVEGIINSGPDSTIITLSHTVSLSGKVTVNPVLHAIVEVESDQNTIYPLTETKNGNYVSGGLNLNNSNKYRLSIKTQGGEQYYSDYVAVLNSPPIDSVNFTITNNGINISSATHDPANIVKYYRWDYLETWIVHSAFASLYKSNGDTVLLRDFANDQIYTCWITDTSSTIVLGSTAGLSKAVITNNPVTSVVSTSEKLGVEYSILVRQYALTGDAYNFWSNIKKNTEQLGSIFDAQPSQISGNIHSSTSPSEPVIGYVSVGSTTNKRIFVRNQQLPNWIFVSPYAYCQLDTDYYKYVAPGTKTVVNQVNEFLNYKIGGVYSMIPVEAVGAIGPPVGYSASTIQCVDCTLRGTNKQPVYWQY